MMAFGQAPDVLFITCSDSRADGGSGAAAIARQSPQSRGLRAARVSAHRNIAQATGNAYCVASTQEGGMIHAAMAAPASMPNANTMIAIISLAVRLSTDRVSSSSAVF